MYFGILSFLFWPIAIIAVLWYLLRRKAAQVHPSQSRYWYLRLGLSREDSVFQWMYLLGTCFLGVTLLGINRELSDPVSWRLVLFVTVLMGFGISYWSKVYSTLIVASVGLLCWWTSETSNILQLQKLQTTLVISGALLLCLAFYIVGHLHITSEKYKRFALVYMMIGIMGTVGILFAMSTRAGIELIVNITYGGSFYKSSSAMVMWLLAVFIFSGAYLYSIVKRRFRVIEIIGLGLLSATGLFFAFVPSQQVVSNSIGSGIFFSGGELTQVGTWWALGINAVTFFVLLGLILSGYIHREEWLINLGTVLLFIFIIVKYFDWFFSFLDKSVFFIGAGVILFGVGFAMEKGRRLVVSSLSQK